MKKNTKLTLGMIVAAGMPLSFVISCGTNVGTIEKLPTEIGYEITEKPHSSTYSYDALVENSAKNNFNIYDPASETLHVDLSTIFHFVEQGNPFSRASNVESIQPPSIVTPYKIYQYDLFDISGHSLDHPGFYRYMPDNQDGGFKDANGASIIPAWQNKYINSNNSIANLNPITDLLSALTNANAGFVEGDAIKLIIKKDGDFIDYKEVTLSYFTRTATSQKNPQPLPLNNPGFYFQTPETVEGDSINFQDDFTNGEVLKLDADNNFLNSVLQNHANYDATNKVLNLNVTATDASGALIPYFDGFTIPFNLSSTPDALGNRNVTGVPMMIFKINEERFDYDASKRKLVSSINSSETFEEIYNDKTKWFDENGLLNRIQLVDTIMGSSSLANKVPTTNINIDSVTNYALSRLILSGNKTFVPDSWDPAESQLLEWKLHVPGTGADLLERGYDKILPLLDSQIIRNYYGNPSFVGQRTTLSITAESAKSWDPDPSKDGEISFDLNGSKYTLYAKNTNGDTLLPGPSFLKSRPSILDITSLVSSTDGRNDSGFLLSSMEWGTNVGNLKYNSPKEIAGWENVQFAINFNSYNDAQTANGIRLTTAPINVDQNNQGIPANIAIINYNGQQTYYPFDTDSGVVPQLDDSLYKNLSKIESYDANGNVVKTYVHRWAFTKDENGNLLTNSVLSHLSEKERMKYALPVVLQGFYERDFELNYNDYNQALIELENAPTITETQTEQWRINSKLRAFFDKTIGSTAYLLPSEIKLFGKFYSRDIYKDMKFFSVWGFGGTPHLPTEPETFQTIEIIPYTDKEYDADTMINTDRNVKPVSQLMNFDFYVERRIDFDRVLLERQYTDRGNFEDINLPPTINVVFNWQGQDINTAPLRINSRDALDASRQLFAHSGFFEQLDMESLVKFFEEDSYMTFSSDETTLSSEVKNKPIEKWFFTEFVTDPNDNTKKITPAQFVGRKLKETLEG